jgi:ABC-type multidrug transport system ATPase subunit
VADIILEEKARGVTVFLSSHILSDVERTCDHVVMLNRGTVVLSESMAKLRSDADEWEIEVLNSSRDRTTIRCKTGEKDGLLLRLLQDGASIGAVHRTSSLEDLYMKYAGGASDG